MKSDQKRTCKLCRKNKKLCKSHIIPEFFYENIYDKDPRKFWYLKTDNIKSEKKIEQKGLRELLLCKECEVKFSKYEKYAAEIIYAKNLKSNVILKDKTKSSDMTIYRFQGYDYFKFKQFLMSILWRLAISKKYFDIVNLDDKNKERIRESLDIENELPANENICFVQLIMQSDDTPFCSTIIGPYNTEYKDRKVVNILIDGFLFSFIIGKIQLDNDVIDHVLNNKGEMSIASRYVNDDQHLMDAVRKMVYEFGGLYK